MEQDELTQKFFNSLSPQFRKELAVIEMAGVTFEIVDDFWRIRVRYNGKETTVSGMFVSHAANNAILAAYEIMDRVVI